MKYDFSAIERRWQKKWREEHVYEPDLDAAAKPFFNLMMFPYPSAEGLHVGNMYAFTGADIFGRFRRMQGFDVFEPIGLDGFGIHSENYAMKIGVHPTEQAKVSEKNFYRQLEMIGNGFAWNERVETYNPDYYRWTQWVFVRLWKLGLAYRKKQSVNWCPSCKTVLADEQVIAGKCERCGTAVGQKELEQWFFRITKYADRLLKNLETIDWSERVKIAQRNWIGKSEGSEIVFKLENLSEKINGTDTITIFTTRPDTLFGATFMVISPELALEWMRGGWKASEAVKKYAVKAVEERAEADEREEKEKTGVDSGIRAVNPANGEKIPVWISDYVLAGYGTGAIMAVPAHDERDFEFAKKFKLSVRMVICPNYPETKCPVLDRAYVGDGRLVDSGKFDGMSMREAMQAITEFVGGKPQTQFRLRDWLVSRQRYWGAPIPMIYCETCAQKGKGEQKEMPGWYAVPERDLPVKLPYVEDFRPKGKGTSPLAAVKEFYEVKCLVCGLKARRETDVSDTFLDSAWYFLRYPSAENTMEPWNAGRTAKWLPVHMYTGGAEHSVLHLLYSRFVTMVFHEAGLTGFEEPFAKFRAHGLLIKEGAKMSKSKGNVVNPDEYIQNFGADTLRMYLMFLAPFEQGGDFRDAGMFGITRFLERVWKFFEKNREEKTNEGKREAVRKTLHKTIKKVTEDIEALHYNTAISALMICLSAFEEHLEGVSDAEKKQFLKLLAPFAPHITEELWQKESFKEEFRSIHREGWPVADATYLAETTFELVVQFDGKHRGTLTVPVGTGEKDATDAVMKEAKLFAYFSGKTVRKVIFVPGRLINFVL